MRITAVLSALVVGLVPTGACDLLTDPGTRLIGIIGVADERSTPGDVHATRAAEDECGHPVCVFRDGAFRSPIDAPDTVVAGAAFQVVVWTSGKGGCEQADGAEVSRDDMAVTIVPYDRVVGPNCMDISRALSRDLALSFHTAGDALIRVRGRVLVLSDSTESEVMGSVEHPVVVLP